MAKVMKSFSMFVVFFLLILAVLEVRKTEAEDKCLKAFGGGKGFQLCAPRIYPSFCYRRCRSEKGAFGGKCVWGSGPNPDVRCLCNYCSVQPRLVIEMDTNANADAA
ncbi:PREDICTED: defensin-like protein 4 [Tarenaya hassleriana]|uniref:defensin-like protein 4 n=1 Tax=Tarenaya hassleriana TaxID=28532 RepID=UPI00053C2CB0|nr:PREDICTED: defensin-like protein 4 [Tarenaya hassleriana]